MAGSLAAKQFRLDHDIATIDIRAQVVDNALANYQYDILGVDPDQS